MDNDGIAGLFFGFLFGCIASGFVSGCLVQERYQSQAIEHGAAEYNPTTGNWQWKEKK